MGYRRRNFTTADAILPYASATRFPCYSKTCCISVGFFNIFWFLPAGIYRIYTSITYSWKMPAWVGYIITPACRDCRVHTCLPATYLLLYLKKKKYACLRFLPGWRTICCRRACHALAPRGAASTLAANARMRRPALPSPPDSIFTPARIYAAVAALPVLASC